MVGCLIFEGKLRFHEGLSISSGVLNQPSDIAVSQDLVTLGNCPQAFITFAAVKITRKFPQSG